MLWARKGLASAAPSSTTANNAGNQHQAPAGKTSGRRSKTVRRSRAMAGTRWTNQKSNHQGNAYMRVAPRSTRVSAARAARPSAQSTRMKLWAKVAERMRDKASKQPWAQAASAASDLDGEAHG